MSFITGLIGPIYIALCMLLRSTDVFFRKTTVDAISPLELITIEHLIVFVLLLPFVPKFNVLRKLSLWDWFSLLFISCGASVGGILCFTSAFQYINPSVVILLQKLQPVVTISLSFLLLQEKIKKGFYGWALVAIVAGYILSFGLVSPSQIFEVSSYRGIYYALAATFLWGSGTVFGKFLLFKIDAVSVTKLRYLFGFIFALIFYIIWRGAEIPVIWSEKKYFVMILYMSLVPGLLALLLFYKGLGRCKASISSVLELIFPLSSVAIVWIFLDRPLNLVQIISGAVMLLAVIRVSLINR